MRSSDGRGLARVGRNLAVAAVLLGLALLSGHESALSAGAGQETTQRLERLVLIDPAHGGNESGAMLNPAIPEKDVNLAFARRLRQELTNHGVLAQLVREDDTGLTSDQRAALVNAQRPTLYISIHSTSLGSGISMITALLPAHTSTGGWFLSWQTAQSSWLAQSRLVSTSLIPAVHRWGLPVRTFLAPLRPLNNITAPAVGIEIAPTNGNILQLASVEYQQMISRALSNALTSTIALLPVKPSATP